MILTAAIGASPETIEMAYDVPQYLNFVHVMCYDYHGQWDKKTGHNAPLYPRYINVTLGAVAPNLFFICGPLKLPNGLHGLLNHLN